MVFIFRIERAKLLDLKKRDVPLGWDNSSAIRREDVVKISTIVRSNANVEAKVVLSYHESMVFLYRVLPL